MGAANFRGPFFIALDVMAADTQDEFNQRISDIAEGPAAAASDGTSVTQQPIDQVIKGANYVAGAAAANAKGFGLRFAKQIPGGCG